MMVKICGITNREDARAAVEAGASALGFNFYPESPRYIAPEMAADLGAGLPTIKVGIFVNESPASVSRTMRIAGIDIAQVYGDAEYQGLRTWRACRVKSGDFTLPDDNNSEAYLLDGFWPGCTAAQARPSPGRSLVNCRRRSFLPADWMLRMSARPSNRRGRGAWTRVPALKVHPDEKIMKR